MIDLKDQFRFKKFDKKLYQGVESRNKSLTSICCNLAKRSSLERDLKNIGEIIWRKRFREIHGTRTNFLMQTLLDELLGSVESSGTDFRVCTVIKGVVFAGKLGNVSVLILHIDATFEIHDFFWPNDFWSEKIEE